MTSNNGTTLLFIAAQEGHLEIVKFLLQANVDIHHPFIGNVKALQRFAKNKNVENSMRVFINRKRVNGSDEIIITPREIAQIMGHRDIVKLVELESLTP